MTYLPIYPCHDRYSQVLSEVDGIEIDPNLATSLMREAAEWEDRDKLGLESGK